MAHRVIGQERLRFDTGAKAAGSLEQLDALLDWSPLAERLGRLHVSSKGEAAWPPLAMFKAVLLSLWYDLSNVKLDASINGAAIAALIIETRVSGPWRGSFFADE